MPQLAPVQISVINASTVLTDTEIAPVIEALQQQVTRDFRPVWGVDAELTFIPTGNTPPPLTWWLAILDDSDQAGALGYHDLTPDAQPIGKVFAGTDLKYGTNWTVTASHELLEMLADPNIKLTVFVQKSNADGILYAYEICDSCEGDQYGYRIGETLVSDFVYPSWFEDFRTKGSTQFDQIKALQTPLQLLNGGYIGIFDVKSGTGWTQLTEESKPSNTLSRGNVGSRRERRATPRDSWVVSHSSREIMRRFDLYRNRMETVLARGAAA
jgi:hypothetical protein